MISDGKIEKLFNQDCLKQLVMIKENIIDTETSIKRDFIISKNWSAVPVESSVHFLDEVNQIRYALLSMKIESFLAIPTEKFDEYELNFYKIINAKENLISFCMECGLDNYLITSKHIEFAILCTSEDHYVLAGPSEFVLLATGSTTLDMRKKFLAYAENFINEKTKKYFLRVADKYNGLDGKYK